MSSAYLCGGIYNCERRRSSIVIAQISKEKDKYLQDEEDVLAQIEEYDSINRLNHERRPSYNNVQSRRISFDFERNHTDLQTDGLLIPDSHRRRSCESVISSADTADFMSSPSMEQVEATTQRSPEVPIEAGELWRTLTDWSVDPESRAAFYWKAAVTVAVLYNCILVISRMAFEELRDEFIFSLLDSVCDAIYLLDLVIEARTSFLSDGLEVTDYAETTQNYKQKSHFQTDLLAICPTQTVALIISGFTWIFPFYGNTLCGVWNYVANWPGVRINRLLKYHTMEEFFQKTESRTNKPNVLRAFKLGTHLCLVIHWFACWYYMLSEYEGLGSNDWVYPDEVTPVKFSKKYITCMFWSVMTLTTIGERPPPQTEVEYIFTGLTFLIGVFVFAAVVGNVGDVISNMNAARRDFQARMDQIKFYMDHRNVPERLQNRVKRWAEYTWDRTNCIDEPSVLQLLPDRLRTEVAIHVHLDVLKQVSIFQDCEEGLLRELVLKLRPQIFSPGDYICRMGEIGRDMYIINHGKVEILFPDADTGHMKQVSVMHPGSFFGEISLLKLDEGHNRRTADVKSLGFSELFCLSRRDLILALSEYPEAKRILEDYGRERYNNTKRTTPLGTDESRPSSPLTSKSGKKSTARTVFERVMRQEGFTKLLENATKSKEISEIKASIEEMKAERKSVKDIENALLERTAELREARAQLASLKKTLASLTQTRVENTSSEGIDLTARWPDLLPASPLSGEGTRRGRFLPKSALHARGFMKEVPTSYADTISKQQLPSRCRGKPFGPLFVGARRHSWDINSLRIQKHAAASLVRTESSPGFCNSLKQSSIRANVTSPETKSIDFYHEKEKGVSEHQQPLDINNSHRIKSQKYLHMNGHDPTLDQIHCKNGHAVASIQCFPERNRICFSSPECKNVHPASLSSQLQAANHGHQSSRKVSIRQYSLSHPLHTKSYPRTTYQHSDKLITTAARRSHLIGRDQTIGMSKGERQKCNLLIDFHEPLSRKGKTAIHAQTSNETSNCLKRNKFAGTDAEAEPRRGPIGAKSKVVHSSIHHLNQETPASSTARKPLPSPKDATPTTRISNNIPPLNALVKAQASLPQGTCGSTGWEALRDKRLNHSTFANNFEAEGNTLDVPTIQEQRKPSISLSLILDSLSSSGSSGSENENAGGSDEDDASDDSLRHS